ncbi:hypothetical protein OIU78_003071 [Salix suchowensis]|nr:hypothetical protein OIU78_003071 [Salix suchowensis]
MSSKKKKKAALYEKLRAATNSNAMNKTSIIVDASKYIGELKKKVDRLNQEIGPSSAPQNSLPAQVTVQTLEKGLDVLDARASCEDNFQLEAIGGDQNQGHDAQVVKHAVLQAILNWNEGS